MENGSDGVVGALKRYRVLIVIVAAIALVALLPLVTGGKDDDGDKAAPRSSKTDTTEPVATDASAEVSRAAGGRLNSKAALAAPDCDAERKHLMVASPWAPPCAEPWPAGADNGGATAKGVTADSIKVVVAHAPETADDVRAAWADQSAVFDHTYRLWGRKVEPVFFQMGPNDEASQRADAIRIADMHPFAVWLQTGGSTHAIRIQELASRGIVVVTANAPVKLSTTFPGLIWGTALPPSEVNLLHITEYVGKRLGGHPAKWAGDAAFTTQPRKFGLVYPDEWKLADVKAQLDKYDVKLADAIDYKITYDQASYQERSRIIVSRLKAAGVNSVIAASDGVLNISLSAEATAQKWFPEWIVASVGGSNVDFLARSNDPKQWAHAFGISMLPTALQSDDRPDLFAWYWGRETPNKHRGGTTTGVNWGTFGLYTGLHMAGPDLTPKTFAQGLMAFPPSGGVSCNCVLSQQVSWGRHGYFPYDDYNSWDDFTEIWWDADYVGRANDGNVDTKPGHYRSTAGGKRHLFGTWPKGEPDVFTDAGSPDVKVASERDAIPDYPCKDCPGR